MLNSCYTRVVLYHPIHHDDDDDDYAIMQMWIFTHGGWLEGRLKVPLGSTFCKGASCNSDDNDDRDDDTNDDGCCWPPLSCTSWSYCFSDAITSKEEHIVTHNLHLKGFCSHIYSPACCLIIYFWLLWLGRPFIYVVECSCFEITMPRWEGGDSGCKWRWHQFGATSVNMLLCQCQCQCSVPPALSVSLCQLQCITSVDCRGWIGDSPMVR